MTAFANAEHTELVCTD